MDNLDMNEFVKIIRDIVQQELKKENFIRTYFAKVTDTTGTPTLTTHSVKLLTNDGLVTDLKNKSGVAIVNDDFVLIYAIGKNFTNAFIAQKCG